MLSNLWQGLQIAYMGADEDTYWMPFLAVAVLSTPLGVLIHELGHAIAMALALKEPVTIRVGAVSGWCRTQVRPHHTVAAVAVSVAAGPAASLFQGLFFTWLADQALAGSTEQWMLFAVGVCGFSLAFLTLIRLDFGGHRTDGLLLQDLWRYARTGQRADWLKGDTDPVGPGR
jgi:hypothetical protein